MIQSILNQTGVQELEKNKQKFINGGGGLNSTCHSDADCDYPYICAGCYCRPKGGPV